MEHTKLRARFIQEAERAINGVVARIREVEADLEAMRAEEADARATLHWLKTSGRPERDSIRPPESPPSPDARPRRPATNAEEYLAACRALTEDHGYVTITELADLMDTSRNNARTWLATRARTHTDVVRVDAGVYRAA